MLERVFVITTDEQSICPDNGEAGLLAVDGLVVGDAPGSVNMVVEEDEMSSIGMTILNKIFGDFQIQKTSFTVTLHARICLNSERQASDDEFVSFLILL